jgi:hypothetical protein
MQNFACVPYASSLEDLAEEYRGYRAIIKHWHQTLPADSIFDVSYEMLVAEPEATVRSVVDFCGLAFEETCMDFHRHQRPIYTSSHYQVRQPIYKTSVRRSDRYREYLDPLLALENELSNTTPDVSSLGS